MLTIEGFSDGKMSYRHNVLIFLHSQSTIIKSSVSRLQPFIRSHYLISLKLNFDTSVLTCYQKHNQLTFFYLLVFYALEHSLDFQKGNEKCVKRFPFRTYFV